MNLRKLLLFDYDGVLADSLTRNVEAAAEAARMLGHSILPTRDDVHRMREMSFAELGRLIDLPDHLLGRYTENCLQVISETETPVRFFPDVEPVLEDLNGNAVFGIVTANRAKEVHVQLENSGLNRFFAHVTGAESGLSKSDHIRQIMKDESFAAPDTYMVGDAASDIAEAKRAGVRSVAATWGYQLRETLEDAGPDYIIDSMSELPGIIS